MMLEPSTLLLFCIDTLPDKLPQYTVLTPEVTLLLPLHH
jgi:hypothetical protein